jgi:hypothetical protein
MATDIMCAAIAIAIVIAMKIKYYFSFFFINFLLYYYYYLLIFKGNLPIKYYYERYSCTTISICSQTR